MVCAGIVAVGAVTSRAIISRQMVQQDAADLRAILDNLRNAPPPPLREIGVLSPYDITTDYGVIEGGGPESVSSSFLAEDLGLEVQISIHTCRPRVIHSRERYGEINLVDGSTEDLCTSGGTMNIIDIERGEVFEIRFKLLGAPNATLGWNARMLVSPRSNGSIWRDSLERMREDLPQCELGSLPPTVHSTGGLVVTRDPGSPHGSLLSGDRAEMLRLLRFRSAFRELYEHPDSPQARQVARLIIDTLLESEEQQELSDKWIEKLGEAG